MTFDPSTFHLINVVDTCSVWNILSSKRLYGVAKEMRCDFCITEFVRYECLIKPRTTPTEAENTLRRRLITEQKQGVFKVHSCTIDDLQNVKLLEERKRLGKGELSSIAFAMRIRQIAVLTDDQKARRLALESEHKLVVQTTPHLFAWLIFISRLGDSDVSLVIQQHEELDGNLKQHLGKAHEIALQCKCNSQPRVDSIPQ